MGGSVRRLADPVRVRVDSVDCELVRALMTLHLGPERAICCPDCHAQGRLARGQLADGTEFELCCELMALLDLYKPAWRTGVDGL